MLANIIYTLIDMYIDIIGEKDREEYKLFIKCLKNNEKYVDNEDILLFYVYKNSTLY